jgi:hypothetical protein
MFFSITIGTYAINSLEKFQVARWKQGTSSFKNKIIQVYQIVQVPLTNA